MCAGLWVHLVCMPAWVWRVLQSLTSGESSSVQGPVSVPPRGYPGAPKPTRQARGARGRVHECAPAPPGRQARHTWALGAASPRASRHLPRPHPPRAAPTASGPGIKWRLTRRTPSPGAEPPSSPDPGPRQTRTRSARERDGGARAPVTASWSPPSLPVPSPGVGNSAGSLAGWAWAPAPSRARVCVHHRARACQCVRARALPAPRTSPQTNLSAATPSSQLRRPRRDAGAVARFPRGISRDSCRAPFPGLSEAGRKQSLPGAAG